MSFVNTKVVCDNSYPGVNRPTAFGWDMGMQPWTFVYFYVESNSSSGWSLTRLTEPLCGVFVCISMYLSVQMTTCNTENDAFPIQRNGTCCNLSTDPWHGPAVADVTKSTRNPMLSFRIPICWRVHHGPPRANAKSQYKKKSFLWSCPFQQSFGRRFVDILYDFMIC